MGSGSVCGVAGVGPGLSPVVCLTISDDQGRNDWIVAECRNETTKNRQVGRTRTSSTISFGEFIFDGRTVMAATAVRNIQRGMEQA